MPTKMFPKQTTWSLTCMCLEKEIYICPKFQKLLICLNHEPPPDTSTLAVSSKYPKLNLQNMRR